MRDNRCWHSKKIEDDIINMVEENKSMNDYTYKLYWHNNHQFYRKYIIATDFLDWRRWLYDMCRYCSDCWEKIDYKEIKLKLKEYDKSSRKLQRRNRKSK